MKEIIAYCGLICNECPAFIATEKNDRKQMKKLAREWSSENYKVSPEEVKCTGCHAESKVVFKFCIECEIRKCGIEKAIDNCGYCDEYPCEKLNIPFKNSIKNKIILDNIHENK